MNFMPERHSDMNSVVYLVGSGIASLAAAAFLIRDGGFPGHKIMVLEESEKVGGSLDAAGNAENGYVMRGGRMIESKYLCTYDLFPQFLLSMKRRRLRRRSSSGTS